MNRKLDPQEKNPSPVRALLVAALVFACAFGAVTHATAQSVTPPTTPIGITPPVGNSAFLVGHAEGTQGYVCLPTPTGETSWTVNPARPEATLFTNLVGQSFQIITHFASINANPKKNVTVPRGGNATWQSSFDTSKVWATAVNHIDAGTDASCPHNGAITCLLLQSVGNQQGPTGGRLLADTTFVQRLNTKGGSAPTGSCTVGSTLLVPYTADYYFFREDK
jgi:Protein of unknown function (DUF3455)